ncbi:TRP-like family [Penicillium chermesinum]|nr:TRP-like family [Penicillium chermesinum]
MKFSSWAAGLIGALTLVDSAAAVRMLQAKALYPCSSSTKQALAVNSFKIGLFPDNNTVSIDFTGVASFSGKFLVDLTLLVYGYPAIQKTLDPCDYQLPGLCPLNTKNLNFPDMTPSIPGDSLSIVPSIAYTVPDIDAVIKLDLKTPDGDEITCLESRITNGKTVDQVAVAWVLAVIIGIGLITTIVLSILGHQMIATHVSFRTLILLGFMQAQAIAGMSAVEFPPMAQNWTQLFQWTLGIICNSALQTVATWFQRATGGTPSTLIALANQESVYMAKRSTATTSGGTEQTVRGIERVGFGAGIEASNMFMTGYLFFYFVAVIIIIVILLFRFALPPIANKIKNAQLDRAAGATSEWQTFMRGSLYRLVALGFPQICVLSMWELISRDSVAEIILAISMWLIFTGILAFATFRVFQRAQAAKALNEHPAYTLYSDLTTLTKWGFLYVNYRATAYFFIVPVLAYTIIKGMVTAFAQSAWVAQSIILLVLELAMMVATIVLRPYLDRTSNAFAITAAVLNFLNSIFMLVFSNVFNQPPMMTGIMGVLWFVFNAIFTLALLIWLFISFYWALTLKDPEEGSKYNRLSDNRESFRMSGIENRMTTELLPLEKTARGMDERGLHSRWGVDETSHAMSNDQLNMSSPRDDLATTLMKPPCTEFRKIPSTTAFAG